VRRFGATAIVPLLLETTLAGFLFGCERPQRVGPPPAESSQAKPEPPPSATGPSVPSAHPPRIYVHLTPRTDEPDLPDYVRVLARFRPDEPPDVRIEITSPTRLVVRTRNVRKLWIDRDRLPMETGQSLVLQLDGQGIEWTAGSTVREFERSINGDWTGTPPEPPQP